MGPAFFGYNHSIARALQRHGFTVQVIDSPMHHPPGLLNRIRIDLAGAFGVTRYARAWRARFNATVLSAARQAPPDLLLVVKGDWIDPEVFAAIPARAKALWFQDRAVRCGADHLRLAGLADAVFVFEGADVPYLVAHGTPARKLRFLPMGYDDSLYVDHGADTRDIDVCLVGRMYPHRRRIVERLVHDLPDVRIRVWGRYVRYREVSTWWLWLRRRFDARARAAYNNRDIDPREVNAIYNRSRIVLNIHHEQSQQGCNPRVFEILGAGAFQICNRSDYVSREVSDAIVQFDDYDGLKAKIVQFLGDADARRSIARRCAAVAPRHTFTQRIGVLLDHIEAVSGQRWPAPPPPPAPAAGTGR